MKNYRILFSFLALLSLSSGLSFAASKTKNKKTIPAKKSVSASKVSVQEKEKKETIKNIISSCNTQITLAQIIGEPEAWLNKEICFSGTFSSFSGLALDYPPAMRERKKYISLTLFRPNTEIPLGELKLAMKIEEAQKHELLPKVSEGDAVKIKGKVFSTALGEPWIDVLQIQITKDPNSKNNSSSNGFDEI